MKRYEQQKSDVGYIMQIKTTIIYEAATTDVFSDMFLSAHVTVFCVLADCNIIFQCLAKISDRSW